MKTYEVEFRSTTYRQYTVTAVNKKFAEEFAIEKLQNDPTVSRAWALKAEVEHIADTK